MDDYSAWIGLLRLRLMLLPLLARGFSADELLHITTSGIKVRINSRYGITGLTRMDGRLERMRARWVQCYENRRYDLRFAESKHYGLKSHKWLLEADVLRKDIPVR